MEVIKLLPLNKTKWGKRAKKKNRALRLQKDEHTIRRKNGKTGFSKIKRDHFFFKWIKLFFINNFFLSHVFK